MYHLFLYCIFHLTLFLRPLHTYQKVITFLTTWLPLLHLSPQNFVMNLITTSALTLSMLLMLFVGGMITVWNILACQGWQLIILLFLVSDYIHVFISYTL